MSLFELYVELCIHMPAVCHGSVVFFVSNVPLKQMLKIIDSRSLPICGLDKRGVLLYLEC